MKKSQQKPHSWSSGLKKSVWLLIGLVAVLIVGLEIYFLLNNYVKESTDKQRFTALSQSMQTIQGRLQASSPEGVVWEDAGDGSCDYYSGTGMQKGGWHCHIATGVTLSGEDAYIRENVDRFYAVLHTSSDLLNHKGTGSYKDFPDTIQDEGGITGVFTTLVGDISCDLTFKSDDSIVYGLYSCGAGALKSWYRNSESPNKSLDGADAWKE